MRILVFAFDCSAKNLLFANLIMCKHSKQCSGFSQPLLFASFKRMDRSYVS